VQKGENESLYLMAPIDVVRRTESQNAVPQLVTYEEPQETVEVSYREVNVTKLEEAVPGIIRKTQIVLLGTHLVESQLPRLIQKQRAESQLPAEEVLPDFLLQLSQLDPSEVEASLEDLETFVGWMKTLAEKNHTI
jgi:hypothetical protein